MTGNALQRRPLMADLMARRQGALIVPGLGSVTWDCAAAEDTGECLYSWGGMGLAVPTAIGIALAQPDRRVVAVTGDGEMLMGIGSLGVAAAQAPANLGILVLDNSHFGETGRQAGLTGSAVDLCAVARGMGIKHTLEMTETGQADALADLLFHQPGPTFAVARIAISNDPLVLPEKDGARIAERFRASLGLTG